MRGIECICVDDKGKPLEIPQEKWVKEGEKYHITHIFVMIQQGKIKGCELAEFDISDCLPYNCYRLSRFAIKAEDLQKLMQLISDCDELNQLSTEDLNKIVREVPLKTELV